MSGDVVPGAGAVPYLPIDCSLHDRLEALATLRRPCRIRYSGADGGPHEVVDRIADVFAADGEEFLRTAGGVTVRLDRVVGVDGVAFGTGCSPLPSRPAAARRSAAAFPRHARPRDGCACTSDPIEAGVSLSRTRIADPPCGATFARCILSLNKR